MKPFSYWFNTELAARDATLPADGPRSLRYVSEKSGLSYTSTIRLQDDDCRPKLTTVDRVAESLGAYLSDIADALENPKDVAGLGTRPQPVLKLAMLNHTEQPDAIRVLFQLWVQSCLDSYNISAKETSRQIGRTESYVSSMLNSRKMCPSFEVAADIAHALGHSLGDVLRQIEWVQDLAHYNGTDGWPEPKAALIAHAKEHAAALKQFRTGRQGG